MPAWLAVYPGATAQTRTTANFAEATYTIATGPDELVEHYRRLFETAGIAFLPNFDGIGTTIRGAVEECDLLITIRQQNERSLVRVNCTAKHPGVTDPAPLIQNTQTTPARKSYENRVAEMQDRSTTVREDANESERKRMGGMEKYDQPYRPPPRPAPPALTWPQWLVGPDGAALEIQKGVDQVRMPYLKSGFTSRAERTALQSYYAGLLNSYGYPIRMQSPASEARDRKAWMEGAYYPYGNPGPRIVIRIDLTPIGNAIRVDLRMTAYR